MLQIVTALYIIKVHNVKMLLTFAKNGYKLGHQKPNEELKMTFVSIYIFRIIP